MVCTASPHINLYVDVCCFIFSALLPLDFPERRRGGAGGRPGGQRTEKTQLIGRYMSDLVLFSAFVLFLMVTELRLVF